jgi:hypothetical protein
VDKRAGIQHTPTPWHHSECFLWACVTTKADGRGEVVCTAASRDESAARANAEFIVRAVNAHDDLLAALKEAEALIRRDAYPCPDKPQSPWGVLGRVRAAIAKATTTTTNAEES